MLAAVILLSWLVLLGVCIVCLFDVIGAILDVVVGSRAVFGRTFTRFDCGALTLGCFLSTEPDGRVFLCIDGGVLTVDSLTVFIDGPCLTVCCTDCSFIDFDCGAFAVGGFLSFNGDNGSFFIVGSGSFFVVTDGTFLTVGDVFLTVNDAIDGSFVDFGDGILGGGTFLMVGCGNVLTVVGNGVSTVCGIFLSTGVVLGGILVTIDEGALTVRFFTSWNV